MVDCNNFKYTCLFGGGAIRGAAHVGVIKALNEIGIDISTIGGSSVGSIVAALLAVGYSVEELSQIFLSVNFELFRDLSLGFNKKFAFSKGEVFYDWIKGLIESKFYGDTYQKGESKKVLFKDLPKNLLIITTDLKTFRCREFSSFETPDFEVALAVRISCCMPGLMRAYNNNDELLVDGDLQKGKPMWSLSKTLSNTQDRILEIRLEGEFSGSDENPIDYVNGMYSCITASETNFVKSVYGQNDRFDYLVIDTGNVVVVDFNYPSEKRQEIIDSGYNTTISYFKDFLVNKKKNLLDIYKTIYTKISYLKISFKKGKFQKAKHILDEIFVLLAKDKEIIDKELFENLYSLHELFIDNIKTGLLGISICLKLTLINTEISETVDYLNNLINGLENYIKKFSFDN